MSHDFEWIRRPFRDDDGEMVVRHYLVDPCGQVRADVEEPLHGRISFIADCYWSDTRYSNWISLDLAKAEVELRYKKLLANNFRKKRRAKIDFQKAKIGGPRRRPTQEGHGFGGLPS